MQTPNKVVPEPTSATPPTGAPSYDSDEALEGWLDKVDSAELEAFVPVTPVKEDA